MKSESSLYQPIWHRALAHEVDRLSSEEFGVATLDLMEQAGLAVANHIESQHKWRERKILVLAGTGNNGGDALVAARHLFKAKRDVTIVFVGDADKRGTPSFEYQKALLSQLEISKHWNELKEIDFSSDAFLVLDGMIGIGLRASLRPGPYGDMISKINQESHVEVVAIDIPSGLDCDGQLPLTKNLKCCQTVTFGALKPCHVFAPYRGQCGEVFVKDIGFADAAIAKLWPKKSKMCAVNLFASKRLSPWKELSMDAHKYDRGHVLVIGGSKGKLGAPLMTALSALRSGAGWVSVALPQEVLREMPQELPLELTYEDFFCGDSIDATALEAFLHARKVRALVLGPGTMKQVIDKAVWSVLSVFSQKGKICFDAGCTHDLKTLTDSAPLAKRSGVGLPHPGEWRKSGYTEFQLSDEFREWQITEQSRSGVSMVYKNATPVFLNDSRNWVCFHHGRNVLAKAGSGDVFAGIVGAFLAGGATIEQALLGACSRLSLASQAAVKESHPDAVVATDLIAKLKTLSFDETPS